MIVTDANVWHKEGDSETSLHQACFLRLIINWYLTFILQLAIKDLVSGSELKC